MSFTLTEIIEQLRFYASLELGHFLGIINIASFIAAIIVAKVSRLTRIIGWGLQFILMLIVKILGPDKFKDKELPEFPSVPAGPHEVLYFFIFLVICVLIIAVKFNK